MRRHCHSFRVLHNGSRVVRDETMSKSLTTAIYISRRLDGVDYATKTLGSTSRHWPLDEPPRLSIQFKRYTLFLGALGP